MIWSFSASRQFSRCQRQWYLKNYVADWRAEESSIEREAYLLSKFSSVFAWRGRLVDDVIENYIVAPLHFGDILDRDSVLEKARGLFDRQLAFARANRLREAGMTMTKAGDDFAALRDVDCQGDVSKDLIDQAWGDVETALVNLFCYEDLIQRMRKASALIAQRPLMFTVSGLKSDLIKVRAVPDLIVFSEKELPIIIDWKVHSFGRVDYRLQLACYALALTRCNPHRDFPTSVSKYGPTDVELLEVQLLTDHLRRYELTEDDIHELEAYIAETSKLMELAISRFDEETLSPLDFPVTYYPKTCARCSFQKICWEDSIWENDQPQEWKQMSLL